MNAYVNLTNCASQSSPAYPEKALFFGTGVLLRALPLYLIDKANRKGIFQGRVVVVKSTAQGNTSAFDQQQNCFTTVVRGIENGQEIDESSLNCAISRVLTAATQWPQILAVAQNPALTLVVSNTTEVGIVYAEESIFGVPPASFPAKLLAVLHQRYQAFGHDAEKGLVIVPTELISENGDKLRGIVNQLATFNNLTADFITWLNEANDFCNSLVDRIVPGIITGDQKEALEQTLGYRDDLMIMAEPYRLWAIEGNDRVKNKLTFAQADTSVKIEPSIAKFKELKLRLLNAPHTFCCAIAHLMGFVTVREAMLNDNFLAFMRGLLFTEISQCLDESIEPKEIRTFADAVLDRFRNSHLDHQWLSISMNYTAKMTMRCVGLITSWYDRYNTVPAHMAFAVASYLRFMRAEKRENDAVYGTANGSQYAINDQEAGYFYDVWQTASNPHAVVHQVLSDERLWAQDLCKLPGFSDAVLHYLHPMLTAQPFALPAFTQPDHE